MDDVVNGDLKDFEIFGFRASREVVIYIVDILFLIWERDMGFIR